MKRKDKDSSAGILKAGLLGRRLGHSLSPVLHRMFGDYEYRLYEREPEAVEDFLRRGDVTALNVTIPYKRQAFACCDAVSPAARRLGNVNVVLRRPDGSLFGDNTDYAGFRRLLETVVGDVAAVRGLTCCVLGAGGAGTTAKCVLEDLGAAVTVNHRGDHPCPDAELLVNATPVGMWPDGDAVPVDVRDYPRCRFALDLVYNPSPTRFVREARARGAKAADGLVMLVAQAYEAARLFGVRPPERERIYLYGPPGSGKSTLGRAAAMALGGRFVDLDAEIERTAGKTIPEIFQSGEAAFRALEKSVLSRVASEPPEGLAFVALGGGALLDPENAALARRTGRIVLLEGTFETLWARVRQNTDRPLALEAEKFRKLLEARKDHYALFRT